MKRKLTAKNRRPQSIIRMNDNARALENVLWEIGVPAPIRPRFLKWALSSLWDNYQKQLMDKKNSIDKEIQNLKIKLPNGTVNKEYDHGFNLPLDKISNPQLIGARELGLSLSVADNGECSLCGKPTMVGDFALTLQYNTVEGAEPSRISIPIAFNPNPRDLWKNIPTDINIQYFKPDAENGYLKVDADNHGNPRKDIVAASQRGRSHAQDGKPRDDHFSLFHCPDSDWYIIAVADGAGSARFSRKGSEIACETVIEHCKKKLLSNPDFESAIAQFNAENTNASKRQALTNHVFDIVYRAAFNAHEAIKRVALANEGFKLKDFATTLMFAICKKFDFGWFIASFWVGDGAMCLYDEKNGFAKLLGSPDEGEFSGQTRFLTMPEIFRDPDVYQKRLKMSIVPDFTALFLMTDGVSDPMFETDKNLNDFLKWKEFYSLLSNGIPADNIKGVDLSDNNEDAKDQLLQWLNFWSPGNHDDRTIAILY